MFRSAVLSAIYFSLSNSVLLPLYNNIAYIQRKNPVEETHSGQTIMHLPPFLSLFFALFATTLVIQGET